MMKAIVVAVLLVSLAMVAFSQHVEAESDIETAAMEERVSDCLSHISPDVATDHGPWQMFQIARPRFQSVCVW